MIQSPRKENLRCATDVACEDVHIFMYSLSCDVGLPPNHRGRMGAMHIVITNVIFYIYLMILAPGGEFRVCVMVEPGIGTHKYHKGSTIRRNYILFRSEAP